jgi:hypothetical protein
VFGNLTINHQQRKAHPVRCAFSTMDSAVLGLASLGCGCCAVRVLTGIYARGCHWFQRLLT